MADAHIRPDAMPSAALAACEPPFDETEYQKLRQRYLEKRVRTNVELPGGRVLRTQTAAPVIEINSPGYRALRNEIKRLERQNDHTAIYTLLHRLAQWDMRRLAQFPTRQEEVGEDSSDAETTDEDEEFEEVH